MKKLLPIILTLLLVCIAAPYASAANVVASPQNLSVDGVDADCDKYNIDGSNYFKLRDPAMRSALPSIMMPTAILPSF